MPELRAIEATYTDWRTVKTRKCLQIIFEVPLERQEEVLKLLGAPIPDQEKWVAIALLDKKKLDQSINKKQPAPVAQVVAVNCQDPVFIQFLHKQHDKRIQNESHAAEFVRRHCEVSSRADIGKDENALEKWNKLHNHFKAWKNVA